MTKLPVLSYIDVIKALSKIGIVPQKPSKRNHIKVKGVYVNRLRIAIIPCHDEIKRGTLYSIIQQLDFTVDEFLSLLD